MSKYEQCILQDILEIIFFFIDECSKFLVVKECLIRNYHISDIQAFLDSHLKYSKSEFCKINKWMRLRLQSQKIAIFINSAFSIMRKRKIYKWCNWQISVRWHEFAICNLSFYQFPILSNRNRNITYHPDYKTSRSV